MTKKAQMYAISAIIYLIAIFVIVLIASFGIHHQFNVGSQAAFYRTHSITLMDEVEEIKNTIDQERRYVVDKSLYFIGSFGGYDVPDIMRVPRCSEAGWIIHDIYSCRTSGGNIKTICDLASVIEGLHVEEDPISGKCRGMVAGMGTITFVELDKSEYYEVNNPNIRTCGTIGFYGEGCTYECIVDPNRPPQTGICTSKPGFGNWDFYCNDFEDEIECNQHLAICQWIPPDQEEFFCDQRTITTCADEHCVLNLDCPEFADFQLLDVLPEKEFGIPYWSKNDETCSIPSETAVIKRFENMTKRFYRLDEEFTEGAEKKFATFSQIERNFYFTLDSYDGDSIEYSWYPANNEPLEVWDGVTKEDSTVIYSSPYFVHSTTTVPFINLYNAAKDLSEGEIDRLIKDRIEEAMMSGESNLANYLVEDLRGAEYSDFNITIVVKKFKLSLGGTDHVYTETDLDLSEDIKWGLCYSFLGNVIDCDTPASRKYVESRAVSLPVKFMFGVKNSNGDCIEDLPQGSRTPQNTCSYEYDFIVGVYSNDHKLPILVGRATG